MCNEAIDTYPSEIKFALECYKTTKRGNTVVDTFIFYLILFVIDIRLSKCVINLFSKNLLCQDILAIDIRSKKCMIKLLMLSASFRFVHDWFVTNKTIEKLGDVVFSSDDIGLGRIDSNKKLMSIAWHPIR